jgi:F0F1-type ATP synthase assembly protein I
MLRRARPQETSRSSFEPAGAGALLVGTSITGIGLGALIGWGAGSTGLGAVAGAIVGVPAGAFAVYRRYRGYFT